MKKQVPMVSAGYERKAVKDIVRDSRQPKNYPVQTAALATQGTVSFLAEEFKSGRLERIRQLSDGIVDNDFLQDVPHEVHNRLVMMDFSKLEHRVVAHMTRPADMTLCGIPVYFVPDIPGGMVVLTSERCRESIRLHVERAMAALVEELTTTNEPV